MSFSVNSTDYFTFNGIAFFDTFHNRVSAIASDAFYTVVGRSRTLNGRQPKIVCDFILANIGTFQIMDSTWQEQILSLWYTAAREQTGIPSEYMISILTEIQSYFSAQTMALRSEFPAYIEALYPQFSAARFNDGTQHIVRGAEGEETLEELFDRSYVFHEATATVFATQVTASRMSWVLPWLILSHMDRAMLDSLVNSLVAMVPANEPKVIENDQPQ